MVENRDIKWDDEGNPIASLRSSGEDGEASWLHFLADFSGLGMATDMPLIVTAFADDSALEWNFGTTPIAKTPREGTPKVAADALDMDTLLIAFRRFVEAESVLFPTAATPRKAPGGVFIDPEDGSCRECDEGGLEVTDADDVSMTVECSGCGACYPVEHDAFGHGGIDYVLEFLSQKRHGPEEP